MGDGLSVLSYTAETLQHYGTAISNSFGNSMTRAEYTNERISKTASRLGTSLELLNSKINCLRVKSLALKSSVMGLSNEDEAEALQQLRLKHICDGELARLIRARFLIEAALLHLETAGVMIETASSIQTAACQFKEIQPDRTISSLEENIEHILDFKDCLSEFEDCMTGNIKASGPEDDQLLEELRRLRSSQEHQSQEHQSQENQSQEHPSQEHPSQPGKTHHPIHDAPNPPTQTPFVSSKTPALELAF